MCLQGVSSRTPTGPGEGFQMNLVRDMQALEERRDRLKSDYDTVFASNEAEADAVMAERARAAPRAVLQMATLQQRAEAYAEEKWLLLADELDQLLSESLSTKS